METYYDADAKIWSSPKSQLYYDFDCSVGRIMFTTMKNYPKHTFQINDIDGRKLTNQEAITWAIRIAQKLKRENLGHNDVVGIAGKNTTYLMPVGIGCFLNCTPFHAVSASLDIATLTHLFELTKPKIIFCDGLEYEKINAATTSFKPLIYTLTDHIPQVPRVEDLLAPTNTELFYKPATLTLGGYQTVAILCSSGTTGMPKAVCLSNYKFVYDIPFLTSEDIIYNSSGLDWMTGVFALVLASTKGCTRVITSEPYTPEYFVELIQKYKVTYAMVAPRHVATLITCPAATTESLASLRFLSLGGGLIGVTSLQRLQEIVKKARLSNAYGLTEFGGITGGVTGATDTSVGKLLPGIRVRIVDDSGNNVGPRELGEIYVHNNHKWNGYYGNPLETKCMQDDEGWFHTGDIGYFDDKQFLYVVDRKKEVLKYQGMQYWSGEIEEVIAELPDVLEVCVVGVYAERHGDAAGAVIVKRVDSTLTEKDVEEHVAKRLIVPHKQLNAGVCFVARLPRNENGKVIKKEAKALFVAAT